jgi:N-carbamoyl-L-amino-acid hydrolase
MARRKNALLGAARLVERLDAIAKANPPGVGTVGMLDVRPNSPNVIPGEVFFMIDVRHPEMVALDGIEAAVRLAADEICGALGLSCKIAKIWDQAATRFDDNCITAVRRAAETSGFSFREMISGAGHDAAYVSRVAPAAMIFVPCRDGISHNEAEFSSKEQCAAGAQVLLQAVLDYDRQLAERHVAKISR